MHSDNYRLTKAQSQRIIAQVDRWCVRTGCNYNRLVVAAGVAPCTRSHVRQNKRRLTRNVATRLKAAMRANPNGIPKADHKARLRVAEHKVVERQKLRKPPAPPLRIDRSPCPKCGTRRDIGCKHFESSKVTL